MSEPRYLIWSNEHCAWWRPARRGYTGVIEWAGVYGEEEAREIVERASRGAQTKVFDPLGVHPESVVPNEVLVSLPDGEAWPR